MRTVYVVTHPEAAHHVEKVVGGWYDSRLTPAGERAAAAIATALRAEIPTTAEVDLYTSDLCRARRTADVIGAALGVDPVGDPRLREKSYGAAEGRPQRWLDERFVPPPAHGDRMNHDEGVPGAETRADLARRVYEAANEIWASPREYQVIVTHGFAATMIITAWIRMPIASTGYANFHTPSGSITTLREDDFFHNRQLTSLGDTRHLTPL